VSHLKLPGACISRKTGDIYAKHRYDGERTCTRCGHLLSPKGQIAREIRRACRLRKREAA
jgi:hypothetical protein